MMKETEEKPVIELTIVRALLDRLKDLHIQYCHWKSNEHVREGICGNTDLDILVGKEYSTKAQEVLYGYGFKRFTATYGIRYSGIEDFIGLDEETGKIVHFHMHYQMTLGEKYLKGYRLPWEKVILDTRQWDAENRIYISNPNIELILLLVRAALKWRLRNWIYGLIGKTYFRGDFKREYFWLLDRIDSQQFLTYCRQLIAQDTNQPYEKLIEQTFNMKDFNKFRKFTVKRFSSFKTYPHLMAHFLKTLREITWTFAVFRKKYLKMRTPVRRTLPSGGIIVVLIGSDGSGKSTIVKKIVEQFSRKIDTTRIYFGSGDGESSLLRFPIKMARKIYLNAISKKRKAETPYVMSARVSEKKKSSSVYKTIRLLWALTMSEEKRKKLRSAWRCRNLGMVVITDRYPQTQIAGINDGPLLTKLKTSKHKWLRSFADREWEAYKGAERLIPDLVIRLNVTPEVAASRKNDMTYEEFSQKIKVVKSLEFDTNVVDIDATQPLSEVLLEVKKAIWAKI
jgi:thymidylate kinase